MTFPQLAIPPVVPICQFPLTNYFLKNTSRSFVKQSKIGKQKLEKEPGNTPSSSSSSLGAGSAFSLGKLSPRDGIPVTKSLFPKELIDSTETKREAIFLSVFRIEISQLKAHPFQHPLPFVSFI